MRALYLEANQTYTQDANTLVRMAELQIAGDAGDDVAAAQREELVFMSVSDELAGAIERADEANRSDPSTYTSAMDDEENQQALFGPYDEAMEESAAATAAGRVSGGYSDQLTLATTVLAISLFIVGIAAVVRRERTRIALAAGGAAIMAVGLVVTALVPIIWP